MFELKPLHKDAIPKALEKAERYRLLNEPWEAESICQDVLQIDADNQKALIILLLSLTDQFATSPRVQEARDILPRLSSVYDRVYYGAIICERRGKALLDHGGPGSGFVAYEWIRQAVNEYEKAIEIRPAGNDDAILRYNSCARMITRHQLQSGPEDSSEPLLE
ncbi:MAG TPA: hypothetical protein VI958_04705 [Acidobacteriota bacterium]